LRGAHDFARIREVVGRARPGCNSVTRKRGFRFARIHGTLAIAAAGPGTVAAFVAARKLSADGAHDKAAEELEKAIRISPGYAEAYVNLAVQRGATANSMPARTPTATAFPTCWSR